MRIGYIITGLTRGGAENQLVNLLTNLRDHDTFVISYVDGPHRKTLESHGIRVHMVGVDQSAGFWRAFRETRRIITDERPDIVHSFLPHSNIMAKLVRLFSGHRFGLVTSTRVKEISFIMQNLAERILDPMADVVTVNSHVLRDYLVKRLLFGRHKVRVIYNGFVFRDAKATRLSTTKRVILTVAQFREQKDHLTNIRTCERLVARRKDVLFAYAGDGTLMERMRQEVRQRGLQEHVRFLGSRDDVPSLLKGSDVFFLPTLYEGQSNALVEAMHYGCPIVTTDIPENRELVRDAGMLVKPRDADGMARAIERVLDESDMAQGLIEKGKKRSKDFSIMTMVKGYEEVYRRLCAE